MHRSLVKMTLEYIVINHSASVYITDRSIDHIHPFLDMVIHFLFSELSFTIVILFSSTIVQSHVRDLGENYREASYFPGNIGYALLNNCLFLSISTL